MFSLDWLVIGIVGVVIFGFVCNIFDWYWLGLVGIICGIMFCSGIVVGVVVYRSWLLVNCGWVGVRIDVWVCGIIEVVGVWGIVGIVLLYGGIGVVGVGWI